jgi:RNA polymerase sigma-70 factor (ECF subfamily)
MRCESPFTAPPSSWIPQVNSPFAAKSVSVRALARTGMSYDEVISGLQQGGRARELAVRALFFSDTAQHMRRFFVAHGASSEEAKDILQETLIKIDRHASSYRGDGGARSWFWQIARNCLADHQRAAGRRSEQFVTLDEEGWEYVSQHAAAPTDCVVGETADECVAKGFASFEAAMPERALVLALQMDGLSMVEIAERIGRSVRAATVYLSECRKKISPFIAHCREALAP